MTKTEENTTKIVTTKFALIGGAILIIFIAGLSAWLYTGQAEGSKRKVLAALPLPVAVVDSHLITSSALFDRVSLAEDLLAGSDAVVDNLTQTILAQLIDTKKTEVLAEKNKVIPTEQELDNAFLGILKQFPNQDEQALEAELQKTYGINLETFKQEVLRETVLQENLSLWHNKQESLNPDSYAEARKLLSQLDNGADFDKIAQEHSEDLASTAFAGDSGFVPYDDLLPEFQTAVKDLVVNDNVIVASRYGIHILRINAIANNPDQPENKSYNIQQIFLEPADFSKWLESELSQISEIRLL